MGFHVRDSLFLHVNGRPRRVAGDDAFLSLSDYLRLRLGLTGTKIVCSEGDCGACSVLVGRPQGGRMRYRVVNSCILFVYQLDGSHVVTVEGLAREGALNGVQRAMVDCFGSQCGYCTPGFVVAMTALFENANGRRAERLSEGDLRTGLSGNLCRCTGYVQIIEAGLAVDSRDVPAMSELYPDEEIARELAAAAHEPARIEADVHGERRVALLPTTIEQAVAFKAGGNVTVASGATDCGVQVNKGRLDPRAILCLNNVPGLDEVEVRDGLLIAGARATWTDVERAVRDVVPQFHEILLRFGSPQIRNAGTVGGNLANASPIADSIPFYYVTDTELELAGASGTRHVNINSFFKGYKQIDLGPDEIIARVITPLPREGELLRLYKVSRRKDLDISTFTAAVLVTVEAGRIARARIAYGGVGPVVLRLPRTEAFLQGREFDEQTFEEAGRIARTEITPISDVRGRAEFRCQLAENTMRKFYHECADEVRASVPAG